MVISYDIKHVIEDYRWTIYIIGIIALGVYKSDRYLYEFAPYCPLEVTVLTSIAPIPSRYGRGWRLLTQS